MHSESVCFDELGVDRLAKDSMGQRIRACREARGVSQAWLAGELGIDRSTIYRYERGMTGKIQAPTVEKIARLLGTTSEYLYYGREPMEGMTGEGETAESALQSPSVAYSPLYRAESISAGELDTLQNSDHFVLRVESDELAPRILPGDLLHLKGCRGLQGSGVYLLWAGEEALLSRLNAEGDIISLDPGIGGEQQKLYIRQAFEETIRIIGFVTRLETDRP